MNTQIPDDPTIRIVQIHAGTAGRGTVCWGVSGGATLMMCSIISHAEQQNLGGKQAYTRSMAKTERPDIKGGGARVQCLCAGQRRPRACPLPCKRQAYALGRGRRPPALPSLYPPAQGSRARKGLMAGRMRVRRHPDPGGAQTRAARRRRPRRALPAGRKNSECQNTRLGGA